MVKMKDKYKTKEQLIKELKGLQKTIAKLKIYKKEHKRIHDQLRLIYDAFTDFITVQDTNYRILSYNKAVEETFGNHLEGKLCYEVYQGRKDICPNCAVKKAIETKKPASTIQLEINPPSSPAVEIYAYPIFNEKGEITSIVEHGKDITEKINMENKLRESEEKYYKLIETANDAIFIADAETGIILEANKKAVELMGMPIEEIVGMHQTQLHPKEELKFYKDSFNESVKKVTNLRLGRFIVNKDGRKIPVEISSSVVTINNKKLIQGIFRDITVQKQGENMLKRSIKDKEMLLQEVHHRVKNNLAIVSALIGLQSQNIKDKKIKYIFKESQNRIKTMSLVHEKLYKNKDFSIINMKEYIKSLVYEIFESYKIMRANILLKLNIDNVNMGIDTLIHCGLIINELVSNSLKYAFTGIKKPELHIDVKLGNDNQIKLIVGDNGKGLPKDIDFKNTNTLGLQIINMLANQVEGKIELDQTNGTIFTISFKLPNK